MNVLVLNCGSSSLKFQIVETDLPLIETNTDRRLAKGEIERIGGLALIDLQPEGGARVVRGRADPRPSRRDRSRAPLYRLLRSGHPGHPFPGDLHAVGHRVVHGGERFKRSVVIDKSVIAGIEDCIELAPLHNPANLRGIRAASELLGAGVPQVAVFDTAFHSEMPETSFLYGIPLFPLPPSQDPALRLPRHVAPLRRLPLPNAERDPARGGEPHHAAPRERLLGVCHPRRGLGGHFDGIHAGCGALDGNALGRSRPVDPRVSGAQGRDGPARDRGPCSTSSRDSWASRV